MGEGAVTERSLHEAWWDRKNRRDSLRRRCSCATLPAVFRVQDCRNGCPHFFIRRGGAKTPPMHGRKVSSCAGAWEWPENSWLVIWQALRQRGYNGGHAGAGAQVFSASLGAR